MKSVFKIWIVLQFIVLNSCIEDYEIDFSLSEKILTLNAEIQPDQKFKVLVALPKKSGQSGDYNTPSDAVVKVYEEGEFFEQLIFKTNEGEHGIYVSEKNAKSNKTYSIEAECRNLPKINAEQKVPDYPVILSIRADKNHAQLQNNDTVLIEIELKENHKDVRFMTVNSYLYVSWFEINEEGNLEKRDKSYGLEIFGDRQSFRDHNWDWVVPAENSNTIKFYIKLPNTDEWDVQDLTYMRLDVPVSELTEDAYRFRTSYRNRYAGNFGETVTIFSNVKNGLGMFSAKATTFTSIQ